MRCRQNKIFAYKVFFLLFMLSLLVSCGTLSFDKKQADLMPRSVAMSIFERYGLRKWAENPYLVNLRFLGGREREYIEFNEIGSPAVYFPSLKRLRLSRGAPRLALSHPEIVFSNVTEDQARELISAAVALGAKIKDMKWAY